MLPIVSMRMVVNKENPPKRVGFGGLLNFCIILQAKQNRPEGRLCKALALREVVSDSVGDNTGGVTAMAITLFQPIRLFPFNSFAG